MAGIGLTMKSSVEVYIQEEESSLCSQVDVVELDAVRRPVVCPRLFVQPEHVTLVLSCGACGGQWSPGGRRMGSHSKHVCWAALSRSDWKT